MNTFKELLKKKGTGPTMSKSLWGDDFKTLEVGFKDNTVPLATKATMLTALLTLEPNPEEEIWLTRLKEAPNSILPTELCAFITYQNSPHPLFDFTLRAIQHEDLNRDDSIAAMTMVLDPEVPDYLKAAFMEAERLKRESFEENEAFLDTFWSRAQRIESDLPVIVDIANAYDGFNRSIFLGPFIAAALAHLGIPTVLHGTHSVAPKFGITTATMLNALNIPIPTTLEEAHAQLQQQGWTYVDQSVSFPELDMLNTLRRDMVKRPVLATIEKFLHPIHSTKRHILVTGYTHPAYKDMTTQLLKSAQKAHEFIFFRGTEGASQLSLDRRAPFVKSLSGNISEGFVSPEDVDLTTCSKIEPEPSLTTEESLKRIYQALHQQEGLIYDTLDYNLAIIASHVTNESPAKTLRLALANALSLFDNSALK